MLWRIRIADRFAWPRKHTRNCVRMGTKGVFSCTFPRQNENPSGLIVALTDCLAPHLFKIHYLPLEPPRIMIQRNRREFIKKTTVAATAASLVPYIHSSAKAAKLSANDRFTIGCIGVGSMGTGDAQGHARFGDVVAVCDGTLAAVVFPCTIWHNFGLRHGQFIAGIRGVFVMFFLVTWH